VLVKLLRYDPLTLSEPGSRGYGSGSGQPDVMFGFLKHLWHTGEQSQALHRCAPSLLTGRSLRQHGYAIAQPVIPRPTADHMY